MHEVALSLLQADYDLVVCERILTHWLAAAMYNILVTHHASFSPGISRTYTIDSRIIYDTRLGLHP